MLKQKIDKMQQNSKCSLCGDRDETIDHISECSKLEQKVTGWGKWPTENCARNLNLTYDKWYILSKRMRRTNFSGILRHKRITYLGQ